MERWWFDIRYAWRRMRATPGVTAIALLTIALGVGANTAIFSISDAVLFRPLPFHDADRMVKLSEIDPKRPDRRISVSFPTFNAWRTCRDVFEALAAWTTRGGAIVIEREPEQVSVDLVSADYFAVYGTPPLYGRTFSDSDMAAGSAPVVILSYAFWQKYFNGDPNVLGRPLHLSDASPVIVGVLPPDFPDRTALYRPLQPTGVAASAYARQFPVIGRLRNTVTMEQARARLETISRQHAVTDVDRLTIGVAVEPYTASTIRYAQPTLRILTGAVLFVLLIACVNVAGLMFARGVTRGRGWRGARVDQPRRDRRSRSVDAAGDRAPGDRHTRARFRADAVGILRHCLRARAGVAAVTIRSHARPRRRRPHRHAVAQDGGARPHRGGDCADAGARLRRLVDGP
jgi:putative ABC transport system permease protein